MSYVSFSYCKCSHLFSILSIAAQAVQNSISTILSNIPQNRTFVLSALSRFLNLILFVTTWFCISITVNLIKTVDVRDKIHSVMRKKILKKNSSI